MHANQKGLTLVELIIVTVVASIVLSAAIPAFGRFVQENRITATTNQLVSHLQYARQEAVMRNANVAACPSTNGRRCTGGNRWDQGWIVYADPDNSRQPNRPEDVLRVFGADERVLMHSAGRFRVRFQGLGDAYGTNLTIRVCDVSNRASPRAVIVSNPGRVRATRTVDASECETD
ncbi:GspH/FimT family pseudopilin [Wenzhouxiangella sp. AB-CW3]|uniref:GspH/FimT family pseudopilin n=1 Tax=Wenzhouxiangella sp. AB-CW3 TaxID=2771012 RepID=UPI00168A7663|nr:GspH/FimT family pseudopilin [Wenzhouxiangella sp. AB-CW3]QOC21616.1 GspH/FimT family pseudopilin [Wenzhouxiangella sp. AB-CW3]